MTTEPKTTKPELSEKGMKFMLDEFFSRCKIQECEDCGKFMADPPSKLCIGCQAYREHQS